MRFSLPIAAFISVVMAGCATPQEKAARQQAKAERQMAQENTRAAERKRMLAIENREVDSERGAQILEYNLNKNFDPNKATAAATHGFNTGKAQTKSFYSDRQVRMDTFQTRDFGTTTNQAAQRQYATGEASTKGKFLNLFASKTARTKTAATKEAADANKAAPSRSLSDGGRQYLGPERKKLDQPQDARELANWRNGGESVMYSDGTVEKMSTMKQLSIDDIRDLLNKSK
ncbi:MAG: hypothetical protein WDN28_10480 [Chthoniobacter sp.]